MKEPCRIVVSGTQKSADGTDNTGKEYYGSRTDMNGKSYLQYEDDEVNHLIVIGSGEVEVVRTGAASSKLVFRSGEVTHSQYDTGYGVFEMDIETEAVKIADSGREIAMRLEYSIVIEGREKTECVLEMTALTQI